MGDKMNINSSKRIYLSSHKAFYHSGLILFCMLIGLVVPASQAMADLLISPTRVAFNGKDRSKQIALINQSTETKTYKVFFRDQKMSELGQYTELTEEDTDYQTARDMVKFSPRQVRLAPGQRQTIRLSLRRPAGLADGEYRSHLVLEGLPNAETAKPNIKKKGVGAMLHARMAFTMPVIVRHGQVQADADLASFKFTPPPSKRDPYPQLDLEILRSGNGSTMGQLKVFWQENLNADPAQIGILNNVAVFPEMDRRKISVRLSEGRPKPGIITVIYAGTDEYKGQTWAQRQFKIAN